MTDYPFTMWFRRVLRQHLEEHRITRNEVARKLGVTGASVHRWDRGLSFPDVEQQAKLAELSGAPEDEIARLVRESERRRKREAALLADHRSHLPTSSAPRRAKPAAGGSWLGGLAGTGRIVGDVIAPATDQRDWDVLR